jgi:hypothetical protein
MHDPAHPRQKCRLSTLPSTRQLLTVASDLVPTVRPFSLAKNVGSPALPRATASSIVASPNARRNSATNAAISGIGCLRTGISIIVFRRNQKGTFHEAGF